MWLGTRVSFKIFIVLILILKGYVAIMATSASGPDIQNVFVLEKMDSIISLFV